MTKPVSQWTKADLASYLDADETSDLEFKNSSALDFSGKHADKNKAELAKDASAMANANGGLIIYGVNERPNPHNAKHRIADSLDEGTDTPLEQIRQILSSNVEPKIAGLEVRRIPFENGRAGYVLEIPAATTFAPHQSKIDKRYYKRLSTTVEAMLDHEVRDLMRRATTPALDVEFTFYEILDGHMIMAKLVNANDAPSLYTTTYVALDRDVNFSPGDRMVQLKVEAATLYAMSDEVPVNVFLSSLMVPHHMPAFRGSPVALLHGHVMIRRNMRYAFAYRIACPGFIKEQMGYIVRRNAEPFVELVTEKYELK